MATTMHEPTAADTAVIEAPHPLAPTLAPTLRPRLSRYYRWKYPIERILAAVLAVPAFIVTAILMLLVRLTSPGPAIYRQLRVGRGGRTFMMYKIRTMVHGAESRTGPVWAVYNDPRLTRVGRVIRKLHLDELPQLWNVLKGDMALIGPRPERPEFTHRLAQEIPGYLDRLMVLPGVTGLAQVNLPPDTDLESVRRKLVLDLDYIVNAGPWLDFRLLIGTALRAIGIPGYMATRLTWIRRQVSTDACVHQGTSTAAAQSREIVRGKLNGHALTAAVESAVPRRAK